MSEEMIKGLKQFRREDLITSPYEYDIDDNCEVFMTIREMIEYSNLQQENNQLKSVIKEIREYIITTTNRNKELNCTGLLAENQVKDLLQIIDKGDK